MAPPPLPWKPIATAPRTGIGFLAYGKHDRDAPPGASRQVKAGDHWWAIILWNIWEGMPRWVFAKDGQDVWSEPLLWLELTVPEGRSPLPFPETLTPELREVLGLMNFQTGPIAHRLRGAGTEIPRRCEDEQAHVLHWLTTLALVHGERWSEVASAHLAALARPEQAS